MTSWHSRPGFDTTPSCPSQLYLIDSLNKCVLNEGLQCGANASHLPRSTSYPPTL